MREMMFTVHYFAEASWLAAAVDFPGLCKSDVAQDALRNACTVAWQFGFPGVSAWLNDEVLTNGRPVTQPAQVEDAKPRGLFNLWLSKFRSVVG